MLLFPIQPPAEPEAESLLPLFLYSCEKSITRCLSRDEALPFDRKVLDEGDFDNLERCNPKLAPDNVEDVAVHLEFVARIHNAEVDRVKGADEILSV